MSLQGFDKFQQLFNLGYTPAIIGFGNKIGAGDITRFSNRVRLAKSFRGINLEQYAENTILGYDAFFKVFLTHSALERFLEINSLKLDALEPLMATYNPEEVIQEFLAKDKQGLLYNFLHKRLNNQLKNKLSECRNLKSKNVAYISASIRHIFAHGHLCAHANSMNPRKVYTICISISNFLLNFMDAEFTKKIEEFYKKILDDNHKDITNSIG